MWHNKTKLSLVKRTLNGKQKIYFLPHLEMHVQLQYSAIKTAFESFLVGVFPFSIDNPERNVFVRWTADEPDQHSFGGTRFFLYAISRCPVLVNEVRIKYIEFVSLNNLGRRIVGIIMCLVVFVPFITRMNAVEVTGFSRAVLVLPKICLNQEPPIIR